ncbi:xanthine dehydrogenase family protein subunit M [Streptomyces sp. DASNCL29]|uniref:FAD binding domain-containing protein n=1 Tax=Streptomyces sp. DASNCL29 TaxID=2583819 RepID=UPI00110FAADE|nr:xanthine dehydrogenase family protein subunit M [Streptomyces sp. DASNCL29]TMU98483.1 xanthine dehydrogenase family protein subunit M [Streptomyces sp. DASNCL29]
MKPAPFDYVVPTSVTEAIRILAGANGDGKIIAGGQSLIPVLALRMSRPAVLVDINRLHGLSAITSLDGQTVRLGALVRHSRLIEQPYHGLLAEAARWIGHTAIRSRGTSGGSIAHADPSAELPIVAAVVNATIHVAGPGGIRRQTAREFFTGALETTLAEDEMITAVDMPIPDRWGFAELSRRHGDFGLVTVAAAEIRERWSVRVGGVGSVPYQCAEAEELLNGGGAKAVEQAASAIAAGITPSDDIHATADYRRAMTEEFTRRALLQATAGNQKGTT